MEEVMEQAGFEDVSTRPIAGKEIFKTQWVLHYSMPYPRLVQVSGKKPLKKRSV